MMNKLYAGIDLHSNNCVIALYDAEQEKTIYKKRVKNDAHTITELLLKYKDQLVSVAVESTYNYYWLTDSLQSLGMEVLLAHPAGMGTYGGLKTSDDYTDASWLAKLSSLNVLPTGYIYPSEQRSLRELSRQRMKLVQSRTRLLLMMQSMITRYSSFTIPGNDLRCLTEEQIASYLGDSNLITCFKQERLSLLQLDESIRVLEQSCMAQLKPTEQFRLLKTIPGIGPILALVILLETGEINRFKSSKQYASYCRRVESKRISNGKKKGSGNRKNGNKYLSWAFMEAAQQAIRSYPLIKQYYQRKQKKVHCVSARNAIAHKLTNAAFYILLDKVRFSMTKAF